MDMGVSKNRGYPKMDGENNGKPYVQMDDLGGFPPIFGNTHIAWDAFPLIICQSQTFECYDVCLGSGI